MDDESQTDDKWAHLKSIYRDILDAAFDGAPSQERQVAEVIMRKLILTVQDMIMSGRKDVIDILPDSLQRSVIETLHAIWFQDESMTEEEVTHIIDSIHAV